MTTPFDPFHVEPRQLDLSKVGLDVCDFRELDKQMFDRMNELSEKAKALEAGDGEDVDSAGIEAICEQIGLMLTSPNGVDVKAGLVAAWNAGTASLQSLIRAQKQLAEWADLDGTAGEE